MPAMNAAPVVCVTGATGLLGRAVTALLLKRGFRVRTLCREGRPWPFEGDQRVERITGDINDPKALTEAVRGCRGVIHLVAAKQDEPWSRQVNVGGMQHLIDVLHAVGPMPVVHVSTQSAKLHTRGLYGETKRQADQLLASSGLPYIILRSSLIYSDEPEGIIGTISRWSNLPVVPLIGKGTAVLWPIHRDDAAALAVEALEQASTVGSTIDIGGTQSITLKNLTKDIIRRSQKRSRIVSIPVPIALCIARISQLLGLGILTRSNVLGAEEVVPFDPTEQSRRFPHIHVRSWSEGSSSLSAKISAPAYESFLLRYVLSSLPVHTVSADMCARLQQALAAHQLGAPLPPSLWNNRLQVGIADTVTRIYSPMGRVQRTLLIAAAIAETSPEIADAFLPQSLGKSTIAWRLLQHGERSILLMIASIPWLIAPSLLYRHGSDL